MVRTRRKDNVVNIERSQSAPALDSLVVTEEAIARRAYEIYESRGAEHGADLDDWFQAERELLRSSARAS